MVKEYGKKLRITNDTFRDRFSLQRWLCDF